MSKGSRIALFLISGGLLLAIFALVRGATFLSRQQDVVMLSALVMLSFVALFLEHFFTTPTDVVASTISILLLMAPLHSRLCALGRWYWIFFVYNLALLVIALSALMLLSAEKPSASLQNRLSAGLKRFAVFFGNGRFLFFSLFFLMLCFYVDSQSPAFLALAAYASILVLVDPKRWVLASWKARRRSARDIGEVFGVQSRNTFLAKLFRERPSVRRFDLVEFRSAVDDERRVQRGMIVETFLLNQETWVRILATQEVADALKDEPVGRVEVANVVYQLEGSPAPELLSRFVGVVIEGSSIAKVRFDYAGRVPISEGRLLEAQVSAKHVLYQVTQGLTAVEALEHKNEAGLIVGEAVQLGVWNPSKLVFEKFGWVPAMNTPMFLAGEAPPCSPGPDEELVGSIPGTTYPVFLNRRLAVTHHTAILGVTGSGKSVFCRDLLRRVVADGTKVICVDFTNEYRGKFPDLAPVNVMAKDSEEGIFTTIDALSSELDKFKNQQNAALIERHTQTLKEEFSTSVRGFMESDSPLALFELPDVSNTTGILEYTKWFFRALFDIARREGNLGRQVCVVLEEAHTVVPEWNFIGVEEKKAQSLVNSISQIALQGRKYGVGFIVVAQRTANVSKTILTQCNSVVAFQQFDKTSADFLLNFVGADMVRALPTLQFRQAIASGKAFRSGAPVIFEVPEIREPEAPAASGADGGPTDGDAPPAGSDLHGLDDPRVPGA